MDKNHYVAIMAGGIGSRFWPMSRTSYPKQFLDILHTGKTLIQATYDRFATVHSSGKHFYCYLRRISTHCDGANPGHQKGKYSL